MVPKLIPFLLLLSCAHACHYLCAQCYDNQFTRCKQCLDGDVKYVNTIFAQDNSLFKSQIPLGVCSQPPTYSPNIYGIIILALSTITCLFIEKRQILEHLSTLQNLAFIALLQINFLNPISYLIQGLKYLFIFSASTLSLKKQTSTLIYKSKYNIQLSLKDPQYFTNIPLIIATNAVVLLLTINVIRRLFLCGKNLAKHISKLIHYIQKFCKLTFFFLIAQNLWTILVALKYTEVKPEQACVMGLFALEFILFCVYIHYQKIQMYNSQFLTYFQIFKKIGYALFITFDIIPIILPAVMISATIFQILFQFFSLGRRHLRTFWYKGIQCLFLIFMLLYTIGEVVIVSNKNYAQAFSWITTLILGIYSLMPLVEIYYFLKRKYWIQNIQADALHNSTNNERPVQNSNQTEESLPIDQINNKGDLPQMATLISEVNVEQEDHQKHDVQKSIKMKPQKSIQQNSVSQPSPKGINPNLVSSGRKSQILVIKQLPKKQEDLNKSRQGIEMINLDQLLKNDSTKQKKQMQLQGKSKGAKPELSRNLSQFGKRKSDLSRFQMYKQPLNDRQKRRINRRKRISKEESKSDQEDQMDNKSN